MSEHITDLQTLAAALVHTGQQAQAQAALVQSIVEDMTGNSGLPFTDRVTEMPTNTAPFHPDFVRNFPGRKNWPMRANLTDITGITVHHTLSHSPEATARYCTATKGYPTTQYHYWVSAGDGAPCWQLVRPILALWHDHTGAHPTTLSVGMAGALHTNKPPAEQIESAARLVVWLMNEYDVPLDQVRGHSDRYRATICPGWNWTVETKWRAEFFAELDAMLAKGDE